MSDKEFELLLNIAIKCVLHKIEAKKNANIRAYEDAKEYYDNKDSAFWHLFEKYLDDFGYNKSIKEFYYENQDTKIK